MTYNLSSPKRSAEQHGNLRFDQQPSDSDFIGEAGTNSSIGDLIAAIRRSIVALGLWILVCVAGGIGYVAVTQPEFVASAQIALEPRLRLPPGVGADAAAAAAAPILDSAQAESQVQIVRSARNLRYVFDTLKLESNAAYADKEPSWINKFVNLVLGSQIRSDAGLAASTRREIAFQNFSNSVQVRRIGSSYVLEVSFRGLSPAETARITNSIAAAYIRDQVMTHAASEQRGAEFLQGRISLIQAQKKAADEAVSTGVITDFQFPDSDARIVGNALEPLVASYPQTKFILLFGALFGLISGIAGISVVHNFDQTLRSPSQINRLLGIDCLAIVPRTDAVQKFEEITVLQPTSEFAASMRVLRTVLFGSRGKSQHLSVGFVGCRDGDGSSTLSSNLAHLFAISNSPVTLVDANILHPDLTRCFAPAAVVGIADVGTKPMAEASLPVIPLTPQLSFVPAGSAQGGADPNVFLGTQPIRAALTELNDRRDVIIDFASLEASPDARAIGQMLSGVVLVASLNRTKLSHLSEAIHNFRAAEIHILGIVVNNPLPFRKSRRTLRAAAHNSSP